ncbi:MAG TPA: repressor LexA [Anaerolineae bacterium]|nr:repressor LexA [Anaerolineae bacterium]
MALSERQQGILRFIKDFIRRNGYPPTIREIGEAVGISSTSVVNYNLNILEREGCIQRNRTVSRGIRVVGEQGVDETIRVPLLGVIAAGEPIPVPKPGIPLYAEEYVALTRDIVKEPSEVYALHVKGNSMIDALVHDGDIVLVRHQEEAKNGEMVVAWLKDREETTLKRFYQEGERIRLQPANPTMEPIYVQPEDLEIQGKVIAVIRQLY